MPLWKAAWFSINETPFPFTVLATITAGQVSRLAAQSSASQIWRMSWPSMSLTCHPKPAQRSPMPSKGLQHRQALSMPLSPLASTMAVRLVRRFLDGGHGGFPDLPLVQFAVPDEAVDTVVQIADAGRQRDPVAEGKPLPQRAGAAFQPWSQLHDRMALKTAAEAF